MPYKYKTKRRKNRGKRSYIITAGHVYGTARPSSYIIPQNRWRKPKKDPNKFPRIPPVPKKKTKKKPVYKRQRPGTNPLAPRRVQSKLPWYQKLGMAGVGSSLAWELLNLAKFL